jgi:hypothetical protein
MWRCVSLIRAATGASPVGKPGSLTLARLTLLLVSEDGIVDEALEPARPESQP